jgi:hypothetical protein
VKREQADRTNFASVAALERQKAAEAVEYAERALRVARRAQILVEGAITTGSMSVQNPGGARVTHPAQFPYIYSQALSLAERLTK